MEEIKNVVDNILFELIVLSQDVELLDYKTSIIQIGVLSQFNDEVLNYFILAGVKLMQDKDYEGFSKMYAEFLVANNKEELALQINDRAKSL